MTTTLSADGRLEFPEVFRKADDIKPGQRCDIERVGEGEYRVRVTMKESSGKQKQSLVELLRSCPVKGFYTPMTRIDTTDDLQPILFE